MRHAFVAAALLAAIGSVGAAHAATTIHVGHAQVTEEPLWLMATPGGDTPNRGKAYDLELIMFRSSADRMKGYEAGALDCATTGPVSLIFAAVSGLTDFTAVATISVTQADAATTSWIVRDDSGIKTAADMKGKTAALNGYKTLNDLTLRMALIQAGLNPDRDVHITLLGLPEGPDAVRRSLVDLAMVSEPARTVELRKGGVRALFDSIGVMPGQRDQNTLFCRKDFLKTHGPEMRAFLSDYIATLHAYLADRRRALDYLAKAALVIPVPADAPLPPDDGRRLDGRVNVQSWVELQDEMLRVGFIKDRMVPADFVDNSYLPAAP